MSVNELHHDFIEFQKHRRQVHLKDGVPHTRFVVVYGLACHADMLSREVLPLLDTTDPRPRLAAVAIVRAIFEAGLTAQWISRTPLAELRIAKRHRDVQREITSELRQSSVPLLRDSVDIREGWYDESEFVTDPSMPPSASVKSICDGLEGGVDLYLIYRMLCGNVHPGVEAIDPWLSASTNDESKVLIRVDPHEQWRGELLSFVCLWGVLWSSIALDDLVKNHPRRNLLNRTSKLTQADLRLMPKRKAAAD